MTVLITSLVGVLGLAVGSFLNVVAYRVPARLSVVRPASACPGCGMEIAARDNVPVLSWLLLGGRCRGCRMRISPRYPLVEAVTGAAFIVVGLIHGPALVRASTAQEIAVGAIELVAFLYLAAISVVLAVIDLDVHRLPVRIVHPAYVVAGALLTAAALVAGDPMRLIPTVVGMVALFCFYLLLGLLYPGGMGLGDVKLAGVLGLYLGYLGWSQLIVGTAAAFLLGGVLGILLLATGRAKRDSGIPFGPWMITGAWIGILVGEPIAASYLTLVGLS